MALRKLLIIGATGKQGGAVIDALIASSAPFEILALTRNTSSPSAQKLACRPNVKVIQGDSLDPAPIFEAHKPIHGVFLVTSFEPGKENAEEAQARPVIDQAVANKVEHLVFTSVDRGGPGVSENDPTNIVHFATKHRIEEYLKDKTADSKTQWTILRPVAFMDNLVPGFQGKFFPVMWGSKLRDDQTLQLISVHDIGVFASKAFQNPQEYKGRAISLAGDDLTLAQAKKVFKEAIGYNMPSTFQFMGSLLMYMVKDLGVMFQWFADVGYGADVKSLRTEEPKLQDFGTWLKETSDFRKQ
ncbi:hypothetical protein D0Z07_6086 [Hyphodiscus hymeniophilus]|uniref:NmrA-like domain-containing protein n=1 Tax=Hyphodiscus hymeniophilus TaxID=353542 RepID=A0A9P7AV47_9HELO|nr:hypothetical protein D0Z07_6086 [Hyphodiscus hymeniophilus]